MTDASSTPQPITPRHVRGEMFSYPSDTGLALVLTPQILILNPDPVPADGGAWEEEIRLASARAYVFDGDPIADRYVFWHAADQDADVSAVAEAISEVDYTVAALRPRPATRTIILDAVEVTPSYRRQGLGLQLAALALDAAGAWAANAMVVAIAGSRDDENSSRIAAAKILRRLGLQQMPVRHLWAASTADGYFRDAYMQAMTPDALRHA